MKKLIFILALIATSVCARAQVDTLFLGDRNPVYYYWDTNWWDYKALYHPVGSHLTWVGGSFPDQRYCKNEYARFCYTDTALRVIGVAAALTFSVHKPHNEYPVSDDELIDNMQTEYFRLYEVDSTSDEMTLVAQAPWNAKMPIRHYMQYTITRWPNMPPPPYEVYSTIYEAYFDSAVTVHDSFYVAKTGNNNYIRSSSLACYMRAYVGGVRACEYDDLDIYDTVPYDCYPNPNHFRRKMHLLDEWNTDELYGLTDTNWHTFAMNCYRPQDTLATPRRWSSFTMMFPIIDTSRIIPPPACRTPNGLTLVYADEGVATLSWTSGNADHWELSLCADGCEPENGTITQWNGMIATLTGLDTAQWYAASVRSVCSHDDSIYYSDWSDSIRFYIPGGSGGTNPTGIETTADRYTYVMPNPASGNVTVASSFRIGDVELLDLNGKSHLRTTVDGLSAALDISSLPAGTYIVRITTSAGTAYKKLVVK
ncbi:MAG: T9SS type A sorting domain-containing protein [Bacteroidales bacterium]|nr:T9SS type A sorting domain-containing protein [Bacteroidales bacterium]MBR4715426.1 T9SS type A sorting domain-containing protein [Bacteroidales bacterium]